MKRFVLAGITLLAASMICFAQQLPLVNPSFEVDENADGVADGWREAIHEHGFDLDLTDAVASEGERSMRITGLRDHGNRACVGQTVDEHELPAAYRLSFDVRGEGRATALFRIMYNPPDGPDGEDKTWHFDIPEMTADAWTEKVIEISVPDAIRAVGTGRVEFYLYQKGEGDLFYDNVAIETLARWTPPPEPEQTEQPTEAAPTGEVVFDNPGFEVDEDDNGMPDGWNFAEHGEGWSAGITDAEAHTGEHSCFVTGAPGHGDRSAILQVSKPATVSPGYRLRFFAKGTGNPGSGTFRFRYNIEGTELEHQTEHFDIQIAEDEWVENVIEFAAGPTAREVGVSPIEVILYQRGEGTVYYDDISVEPIEAAAVELKNAGFEIDENQDGTPDFWRPFTSGEGFELTRSEDAHSGEYAACITGLPDHADRACYGQTTGPVVMAPGYRLSVWVKGEGKATGIFRYRYTDADGADADDTQYFSFGDLPADEWQERTFEFATSKSVLEADVSRIELLLYQRDEGTLCFDDVRLEPMTDAPTPEMTPADQALQTPRRPTAGKVVLQNPPDFTWPPQAGAEGYELQLADNEGFDGAVTVTDLPYNCLSHAEVLDPDSRWWWRYRYVRGDQASEWSEAWSFGIAPDAHEFPVPRPAELLARVPVEHPRVYATRETLEQFRAPRLDEKADWWEQFKGKCEAHLEKDIPSEPGPEYDFSDRSGALTSEEKSRMDALRGLGGRATGPMWEMAFGYLVSGDERFGERAVDWLMELSGWDVDGTTGYHNHDQVFRDIAWKSACTWDWCWDLMDEEQRAKALSMIEARGGILYRDFKEDSRPIYEWPFNSHGWTSMGFLGIIACATAHDSAQADEWLQFIAATYPALYPPWGGEEGGWCQGTAYWKWSVRFFAEFADAFASATGVDLFDRAFCRNNGWFKLYMHPPFCDRHHFGDGNLGSPGGTDRNNQLVYATRYDNPYFKWYADQIHGSEDSGVFGYWWYDYDMPARPPVDVPQSRYLADIGWVGMHSDMSDPDDIMLIFKSSWYGSFNHSHADQNHFVINAYGEPLLIDSGYYDWYGSDHDRNWTRQTKAHNDILVDGEGQPIFDITAKGEITDYFESPVGCYTAGDATAAYEGKLSKFVRHVLYLRPDTFVVIDELEAEEPSTWTWTAHALEEMEIDDAARRVTIEQGEAALDIAFATPAGLAFTQDNDWDGHPPQGRYEQKPNNWHLFAETTEPSRTQRFVTLMRVRKGGEAAEFGSRASKRGNAVVAALDEVAPGGNRDQFLVGVRSSDGSFELGDSTIDAAAVALTGHSTLAVGCRSIAVTGHDRTFFRSSEPVTVALAHSTDAGNSQPLVRADIEADTPTEVSLWLARDLDGLTLNGEPLTAQNCRFDADTQMLTLSLDAGMHSIAAPEARPVAEGSFALTIDGEAPAQIDQEVLPAYTGSGLLFANFAAEEGLHRLAGGAPQVPVTLNGAPLDATGGLIWLRENNSLEARLTEPATVPLALERIPVAGEPQVAQVLDEIPEDALKIEAESFVDYGRGSPSRYSHRTFLSGGVGVGEWIVPGMWLQWNLDVPAGDYHLVVKGSTHLPHADRLIMLDGRPVAGQWQLFRFEHTGGFGATPEEWAHMLVLGPGGDPLTLKLTEGTHELRSVCIENRLNLDYLMLVPVE